MAFARIFFENGSMGPRWYFSSSADVASFLFLLMDDTISESVWSQKSEPKYNHCSCSFCSNYYYFSWSVGRSLGEIYRYQQALFLLMQTLRHLIDHTFSLISSDGYLQVRLSVVQLYTENFTLSPSSLYRRIDKWTKPAE